MYDLPDLLVTYKPVSAFTAQKLRKEMPEEIRSTESVAAYVQPKRFSENTQASVSQGGLNLFIENQCQQVKLITGCFLPDLDAQCSSAETQTLIKHKERENNSNSCNEWTMPKS